MLRTSKIVLFLSFVSICTLADEGQRVVGTRLLPSGATTSLVQVDGNLDHSIVSLSGSASHPKVSVFGVKTSGRYLIRLKDQPVQPIIKNMKQQLRVGEQPNQNQAQQMKAAVANQKLLIASSQNKLISRLSSLRSLSKVHYRFSELTNTLSVTLKDADLGLVKNLPEVEGVYPDNRVSINAAENIAQIKAPDVWSLKDGKGLAVTGSGIKIAILDTGIDYSHPDLGGCVGINCKVRLGQSFVEGKPADDFMDRNGHGTHVAGIASANGALKGVAPDATLYAFKVLDDSGSGQDSGIIAALEKAVNPDGDPGTDDGADVINLSLGGVGAANSPLSEAANAAMTAGVVVVVASGNEGPNYRTIGSPGNAEKVLTVGAVDQQGVVAYFSSRGPIGGKSYVKPEVLAPGVNINSLKPGNGYAVMSGTSMAAPHVAGAAALMLQLHPNLKPEDIKALLMTSAHRIDQDVFTQGTGIVDLSLASSLQWVIQNQLSFVGNVDIDSVIWEQPFTLNIKNISQQKMSLNFFPPQSAIAGLSLSLPISSADLEPLASAQYNFKANVDNALLGFPTNNSMHFESKFSVVSGLNDISVSAVIVKSAKITVPSSAGLYSANLLGRASGQLNQIYRGDGCGANPEPYEFYVNPGTYDALLYFCDGSIVAKESLNLEKNLVVKASSDDANLIMKIDQAKLLDGRILASDNIVTHSGIELLFHEPSKTAFYIFFNRDSPNRIKLSPMSNRIKFSAGVLYNENTPDWSDLYFINWYRPDGIAQSESKALDMSKLVELDFRYADKKMVQQGVLDAVWVKEINSFLQFLSLGTGTYNYPFREMPLHRKIYSEPTTLAKSEFVLDIEVEKKDPNYFMNTIASTDYIGLLSQTDILKFSSPYSLQQQDMQVFPNKGIYLDGNGYFFPLQLRYHKDYKIFDEVDADNFIGWVRGVDGVRNRFYDVTDFKTYCDDNLLISGTRPLSPYPSESTICDIVKIERSWENRYLDKVGEINAVQQLDMIEAKRSDIADGWATPMLDTLVFSNGGEVSRVLNTVEPKIKFSFRDQMKNYLTNKNLLTLEYKLDNETSWRSLNVEVDGNYFVARLPLLSGAHDVSLHIKYKGTGRSYMEHTLKNVLVLGRGAIPVISSPEFSLLPDIVIEAAGKLTSFVLPDVYATDFKEGKIKATTANMGPYPLGKNTILWSAKNASGMQGSASQTLLVQDTKPPIVTAPANISQEAKGKETSVSFGVASATDEVDGILPATTSSDGAALNVGQYSIEWKATDLSGNVGSAVQTVVIKDATAPSVVAPPPLNITAKIFPVSVSLGVATAMDIVDGVLTPTPSESGPFNEGQYTIIWAVKDKAGNLGTATQTVNIAREVSSNNGGGGGGGGGSVGIAFLTLLFFYTLCLLPKQYFKIRLVRA